MLTPKLLFLSDPGHGWLKVPLTDIVSLNLQQQISRYSFIDNGYAYLEEDGDAPRYLAARTAREEALPAIDFHYLDHFQRPALRFQDGVLDDAFWARWGGGR